MELPELSLATIRAILSDELDDTTVNALVWRSLNYTYDSESHSWEASTANPPWNERNAPDFIASRPDTIQLTRSIPAHHKQLLKERLGFEGYSVRELTPRKTRRATVANWLLHCWVDRVEARAEPNNGKPYS
jgi:hypothetical protein